MRTFFFIRHVINTVINVVLRQLCHVLFIHSFVRERNKPHLKLPRVKHDTHFPTHSVGVVQDVSETVYSVSQKNCAKLFLSELPQILTNIDDFWQKDGKEAKFLRGVLIFHFT